MVIMTYSSTYSLYRSSAVQDGWRTGIFNRADPALIR